MIAIYLNPPKNLTTGEDYLLESSEIVAWWDREKIVGNAVLVPVEQLRPLLGSVAGLDKLRQQEDAHVVMPVRRS